MVVSANILLFDGVCNLCNKLVKFIVRIDRNARIRFASTQSESARSLLESFDLASDKTDTVLFISHQKVYLKSTAILHLLNEIGGIWKIFYVFILVPVFIRDIVYDLVARNRYKIFGRTKQCSRPSGDLELRFLH